MFRALIPPIFRSTRLCVTACGVMHPRCCGAVAWKLRFQGETLQISVMKFLPHMCNVCGRNLITGLTSDVSPSVDISSTCKVGQKLGVSLPLLTCSPSAWPSRLLYRRGRKYQRELMNYSVRNRMAPLAPKLTDSSMESYHTKSIDG